jgi:crotonobetainyl-CoA:carnitine CoA-transferase CaiB-like acyl-CoA transferase
MEHTLSRPVIKHAPLLGIKVVDLSTMIAAPLGASILADYGAEVIKIEPRDSCDLMRFVGSQKNGMSGIFALNNRGKKAIAVNARGVKGREVVDKLIRQADVLIHNFRPDVMESLGFGYEQIKETSPNLIYVHVLGFGNYGNLRNNKAYDNMIQAITGMGTAQSDPPEVVHQLLCDKITAQIVAQAVLGALFARERGQCGGQYISISMLDVAANFMWQDLGMDAALLDDDTVRSPTIDKYYRTITLKDGYCAVTPASDSEFAIWAQTLRIPEILEDERFNSIGARFNNAPALIEITDKAAKQITVAEVEHAINNGLPAAIFADIKDLPNNEQIKTNSVFIDRTHPTAGMLREARLAPMFSETPLTTSGYAPMHGEHTGEILDSLGYWAPLAEEITR